MKGEKRINKEIVENIINFYQEKEKECTESYLECERDSLNNIYIKLENEEEINLHILKSAVLIITANKYEKNILHVETFKKNNEKIKRCELQYLANSSRPLSLNAYFLKIGNYNVFHIHALRMGSYSMGGSADVIRYALRNKYFFPSVVISYGICFGIDYEKNSIGDVIIAKKLYPYFMNAKIGEKGFYYVEDSNIFDMQNELNIRLQHLLDVGSLKVEEGNPFYGNMITGEAVISNIEIRNIVKAAATNQVVYGGEMEGYGLFKECQGYEKNIPCILVKAICDWGAVKNIKKEQVDSNVQLKLPELKDKIQAYASKEAYKVVEKMLKLEELFKKSCFDAVKEKIEKEFIAKKSKTIRKDSIIDIFTKEVELRIGCKEIKEDACKDLIDALVDEQIIKFSSEENIFDLD